MSTTFSHPTATRRPLSGTSFIAGQSSAEGKKQFRAWNPEARSELEPTFFCSTPKEIAAAAKLAQVAAAPFAAMSAIKRGAFLRRIADCLEEVREAAVARAHEETALPIPRLNGELARTQNQLRMFADLVMEGSWVDARIDHGDPDRKPLPKPDLRRMLIPLGPVAVFGASNFPFAYSVAGGDTASALSTGCPVIVKAHPAHPGASELVALAILKAASETEMPEGVFSMLHGGVEEGSMLVLAPEVQAVGFTGSFTGGTQIAKTVGARPRPIPVFAEMGSVNPVVVLPSAIARENTFAKDYAASLTLGVGQFCTNPGLLFGVGEQFDALCHTIRSMLRDLPPATMLTPGIADRYRQLTDQRAAATASETDGADSAPPGQAKASLFLTDASSFKSNPSLVEEVFGPSGLAVRCDSVAELLQVIEGLPGQLTGSVHGAPSDPEVREVLRTLERIAGRVICNGFPTGVEVCPSMHHGGPFPATLDGASSSVGTAAVLRFVRPVAFQDTPDELLPLELQEANPLGVTRLVDGKLIVGRS